MHRYRTYSWAEPKHLWTKVQKSGQLFVCVMHLLWMQALIKKTHGFRCIKNEPHAKDYGIRSLGVNSVLDIHFFIPEINYSYAGTVTLHQEWKALDLVTIYTIKGPRVWLIRSRARRVLVTHKYSRGSLCVNAKHIWVVHVTQFDNPVVMFPHPGVKKLFREVRIVFLAALKYSGPWYDPDHYMWPWDMYFFAISSRWREILDIVS